MQFKILKETVTTRTNIFGKPIARETICYIYQPVFFGLFKRFLQFITVWNDRNLDVVEGWHVYDKPKEYASKFSEQEAEEMLKRIYSQPDKFISIRE